MANDVYGLVRERDNRQCMWPMCGQFMGSVHHVLTRGIEKFRYDPRNLICLCGSGNSGHHAIAHGFKARVVLLKVLHDTYGYEYPEEEFRQYVEHWDMYDRYVDELKLEDHWSYES